MIMLLESWIEEKSETVSSDIRVQLGQMEIQMLEVLKEVSRDYLNSELIEIIAAAEEAINSISPEDSSNLSVVRLKKVLNKILVNAEAGKETMEFLDRGIDCVIHEQNEERIAA